MSTSLLALMIITGTMLPSVSGSPPEQEAPRERIISTTNTLMGRQASPFDDKARQYLSFAYRMMTNGKKYEMPEQLDQFVTPAELQEKSLRYMEGLVTRSLQSLEAGNSQDTARLLLEMVFMTITPNAG